MVIFFTEEDLVSFGTYMISKERKDVYLNNVEGIIDQVDTLLSQVNTVDLENWVRLLNKQKEVVPKSNKDLN